MGRVRGAIFERAVWGWWNGVVWRWKVEVVGRQRLDEEIVLFLVDSWPWIEFWGCEVLVVEFGTTMVRWMDERDVVSKPEMLASISLPFVEARACLMSPRCLEILALLETKKPFSIRSLESLRIFSLFCLGFLASARHVGSECLVVEVLN